MTSKRVIVIGGPTASGKTELGIAVALATGGEIVSADSMQIYKGMDIGTAKASEEEQMQVAHHMIDVADPRENYSVARYVEEASECCDRLLQEGKIPVIVGGTGLYIDSLLAGEKLLEKLRSFDPERAALLHPADKKRIVRAMEVYYLSGETITEHDRKTREIPPRYEAAVFIPGFHDRALLYERIDRRVGEMIRSGLFEEVKTLLDSGIPARATAMQAIGYKEAVDVVYGRISAEEAADRIRQASRRYAKRQITWFARRQDAVRLFHDSPGGTEKLTEEAVRLAKESIHDNC